MFYEKRRAICVVAVWAVAMSALGCEDQASTEDPISPRASSLTKTAVSRPSPRARKSAQDHKKNTMEHTDYVPVFRNLSPREMQTVKRGLRKNQWIAFDCCRLCLQRCAQSVGACTEETPCGLNADLPGDKSPCVHPEGGNSLTAKACAGLVEETLGRFTQR